MVEVLPQPELHYYLIVEQKFLFDLNENDHEEFHHWKYGGIEAVVVRKIYVKHQVLEDKKRNSNGKGSMIYFEVANLVFLLELAKSL